MPIDLSAPSSSQWIFLPSQLILTPSSQEDIPFLTEFNSRKSAINKIKSLCSGLASEDYTKAPGFAERNARAVHLQGQMFGMGGGGGGALRGQDGELLLGRNDAEHESFMATSKEYQSLPQAKDVITTAATFLHRFYTRYSLTSHPTDGVAASCLYLALKVEDKMNIKAMNVARIAKAVFADPKRYEPGSTARWENTIVTMEETILEALCYDLTLEQPLGILLKGSTILKSWITRLRTEIEVEVEKNRQSKKAEGDPTEAAVMAAGAEREADNVDLEEEEGELKPSPVQANFKLDKGKGKASNEEFHNLAVELAYLTCYETITTPLCLLSLPNHIAASSLLLSLAMLLRLPPVNLLEKLDDGWIKAFCVGYTGPEKVDDVKWLQEKMRGTIVAMLQYQKMGLMNAVVDSDWREEDFATKAESATQPESTDQDVPPIFTEPEEKRKLSSREAAADTISQAGTTLPVKTEIPTSSISEPSVKSHDNMDIDPLDNELIPPMMSPVVSPQDLPPVMSPITKPQGNMGTLISRQETETLPAEAEPIKSDGVAKSGTEAELDAKPMDVDLPLKAEEEDFSEVPFPIASYMDAAERPSKSRAPFANSPAMAETPLDVTSHPGDVLRKAMSSTTTGVEGKMSVAAVSERPLEGLLMRDVADVYQQLTESQHGQ